MNWKNRLTNYNFWISIFSAVLLILQAFKIEFDIGYVNEIFTAVLGLLVVIGIISDPTRSSVKTDSTPTQQTENKTEMKQDEIIPINKKDEIDNDNFKNDLQTIITTLTSDLDEKIQEFKKLNDETVNKLNSEIVENKEKEEVEVKNHSTEEVLPAVAEIDNPYIDVIN